MKKIVIIILIATASQWTYAQNPGSVKYLDVKNGFKNIILGSDISALGDKIKEVSEGIYEVTDTMSVGDIKLDAVSIRAYKGKILSIYLFPPKSRKMEMYQVFREAYGIYSDKPNQFMDNYKWNGRSVDLTYNFDSTARMPMAVLTHKATFEIFNKDQKDKSKNAVSDL